MNRRFTWTFMIGWTGVVIEIDNKVFYSGQCNSIEELKQILNIII